MLGGGQFLSDINDEMASQTKTSVAWEKNNWLALRQIVLKTFCLFAKVFSDSHAVYLVVGFASSLININIKLSTARDTH